MSEENRYGARLERGVVIEVGTRRLVRVKSLERPDTISQMIWPYENANYAVGTEVFYFQFEDGTGLVMGKAYVHPETRRINNQST